MKYASIHYSDKRISTCDIAGAVALCAVHDLRVNLFRFGGFPHILVVEEGDNFRVTISILDERKVEDSFILSRAEAFNAAKSFKDDRSAFDPDIFDRVQNSLAIVVG